MARKKKSDKPDESLEIDNQATEETAKPAAQTKSDELPRKLLVAVPKNLSEKLEQYPPDSIHEVSQGYYLANQHKCVRVDTDGRPLE
tara:strand:- start:542 stop:802 length:261 start_codon:yes stop_codon:yes gene_type:complete